MPEKITKSDEEWKQILTHEQYHILRKKGTEPAFDNEYYDFKGEGIYVCAACGNELFDSSSKFQSGSGWPSFYQPINPDHIETRPDKSLFALRTEVLCAKCQGHLGHVFEDGPKPTGLRYCMNSGAMRFVGKEH